eukprot:3941669-Rhodomonas_salina.2
MPPATPVYFGLAPAEGWQKRLRNSSGPEAKTKRAKLKSCAASHETTDCVTLSQSQFGARAKAKDAGLGQRTESDSHWQASTLATRKTQTPVARIGAQPSIPPAECSDSVTRGRLRILWERKAGLGEQLSAHRLSEVQRRTHSVFVARESHMMLVTAEAVT